MSPRRYFIHTFGCQMNVNDTLRMGEALAQLSYTPTPTAEQADLIILNTCSIREKAEELSALNERYRPFADRITQLAIGYQSKALLRLVEKCEAQRKMNLPEQVTTHE